MFDILITMLFLWLFFKAIRLAVKAAWSLTKVIASLLIGLAGICLILGIMFTGAVLLMAAAVVIAIALLILRLYT